MMSVSQVMTYRPSAIATTEFPTTNVIENVGVRPDIPVDYMTKDNLVNNGSDFVGRFTQAILAEIRKNN